MYFPFLYGRRSELLALRAMLGDGRPLDALVPLVEPVNRDISDVAKCVEAFGGQEQGLAVVVNPDKHQLKPPDQAAAWRNEFIALIEEQQSILPTLKCKSSTTAAQVQRFLKLFEGRSVAIAYSSPSLSDAELTALAGNSKARFHVVLNGKMAADQVSLLPKAKRVDVRDYFNKLDRNSDYAGTELFTDRHLTYKPGWAGFGDFASIGSAFTAGGTKPAAVAIHAVYKHKSGNIWMEHFVSDDTDKDIGDTASKFLQAASKLIKASKARPKELGSNFALDEYDEFVKTSHFPGLGTNKVLQLEHHICLMLDVMSGAL